MAKKKVVIETYKGRRMRCSLESVRLAEKYHKLSSRQQLEVLILIQHSPNAGGKALRILKLKAGNELPWDIVKELGDKLRHRRKKGKPDRNERIRQHVADGRSDGWIAKQEGMTSDAVQKIRKRKGYKKG